MVREIKADELSELLELYLFLHEDSVPEASPQLENTWETIFSDKNHHIIVNEKNGKIVSSCVCVVIPNLTRGIRPYALIENVVTHEEHRGKGYASECLGYARKIAEDEGCYKIMLLTGSKDPKIHNFYKSAGYNSGDKTAYIMWL